jgi:PEP-CTERM/exosortase A-associated glycosyltransferase
MKILHVLDHSIPLHSGYTFRTKAILEQQRSMGWETAHVTSPKHSTESPEEEVVDGLRFYRTRSLGGPVSKLSAFSQFHVVAALVKCLEQVIEKEKPDVLHAHSPALNALAALRAGRKHGLPVVYECRAFWEDAAVDHGTNREGGARYLLTRFLETHVFRRADAVTTICEGLKNDIVSRGIPAKKITVIPNAVDLAQFSMVRKRDQTLNAQLGMQGKTVLGFIGSFYAYEGLSLLLRSLPGILANKPDVGLLLVGGGPQEKRLKELALQVGVKEAAVFVGRVPHDEVGRYYDLVDIFVYPREKMRLTDLVTPLKPLEAMAKGSLVLASDVGGHKELIRDRDNGRLFTAGSSDALTETVVEMLENTNDWDRMRQHGRKFVEQERNWPVSVARYRGVYGGIL